MSQGGKLSRYFREQMLAGNKDALRGAALVVRVGSIVNGVVELSLVVQDSEERELVTAASARLYEGDSFTVTELDMAFVVTVA
jgi:hypothetical protein